MDLTARKYRLIQELIKIDDEKLMDTLEEVLNLEEENSQLSTTQKEELNQRLKKYKDHPEELLDWNEVKPGW